MVDNREETMSAEMAADFAALDAMAGEQDAAQAEAAAALEPERPDLAAELSGLINLAVGMLGPVFPSLKDIYTEQTIAAAAGATAAVCNKHGWLQSGLGGKWGEEIMLLVVVGPLAYATYGGIRGDIEKRLAAEKAEQLQGIEMQQPVQVAQQIPGSNTVSFGGQSL